MNPAPRRQPALLSLIVVSLWLVTASCKPRPDSQLQDTPATTTPNVPVGGGDICANYFPGKYLAYANYEALASGVFEQKPFPQQGSFMPQKYDDFLQQAEPEFLSAIASVFSDPGTLKVFYGTYNSEPGAKDGGMGFRVIWSKTIANGNDKRLVNVITFHKVEAGNGGGAPKVNWYGGADSFRVRVQLEADSKDHPTGRFGAMSFSATLDDNGKVTYVHSQSYLDNNGAPQQKIPYEALPNQCSGCHFGQYSHHISLPATTDGEYPRDLRANFGIDVSKFNPQDNWGIGELVRAVPQAARLDFQRPHITFWPQGIKEAIAARCRQLSNRSQ